jgi:hypothetical protein
VLDTVTESDIPLVSQWWRNFTVDIGLQDELPSDQELLESVQSGIKENTMFLWKVNQGNKTISNMH